MNQSQKFNIKEFEEIEKFIFFYSIEQKLPENLFFIENQIIFLVENILLIYNLKPNLNENLIILIINLYEKLNNKILFKKLIIQFNNNYSLFFLLWRKNFLTNEEIFEIHNLIINPFQKTKFELYFLNFFNFNNLNKNNIYQLNIKLEYFENNNEKLYELINFGWIKNSLEYFIKYDELNNFLTVFAKVNCDFNSKFKSFYFEYFLKEKKYSIF